MAIVIVPAAVVAIMVVVPFVTVFKTAVRAIPISAVEPYTVMARAYPARTKIGRTRPVAGMPAIVSADRIPIAVNPKIFRAWSNWPFHDYSWRRRSADANPNRDLRAGRIGTGKQKS